MDLWALEGCVPGSNARSTVDGLKSPSLYSCHGIKAPPRLGVHGRLTHVILCLVLL